MSDTVKLHAPEIPQEENNNNIYYKLSKNKRRWRTKTNSSNNKNSNSNPRFYSLVINFISTTSVSSSCRLKREDHNYSRHILRACTSVFVVFVLRCITVLYYYHTSIALCELIRTYMDLCHTNTILTD